jgi:uncharacterized protein YkwD
VKARKALAAALLTMSWTGMAPAFADAGMRAEQDRMLAAVNEVRDRHGMRPLRVATSLRHSASAYARWMLRHAYFGHRSRIRAGGAFRWLGENLAWHRGHRPRVRATVARWLASPPHRALLLSPGFRRLGAGVARGRYAGGPATAWVLHFGSAALRR